MSRIAERHHAEHVTLPVFGLQLLNTAFFPSTFRPNPSGWEDRLSSDIYTRPSSSYTKDSAVVLDALFFLSDVDTEYSKKNFIWVSDSEKVGQP